MMQINLPKCEQKLFLLLLVTFSSSKLFDQVFQKFFPPIQSMVVSNTLASHERDYQVLSNG